MYSASFIVDLWVCSTIMTRRISARLLGCLLLLASDVFNVLRQATSSRNDSVASTSALAEPINVTRRRRSLFAVPHDSGGKSRDDEDCSKHATLFIAIQSDTEDQLGRMAARHT